jgi:hypothetical protein
LEFDNKNTLGVLQRMYIDQGTNGLMSLQLELNGVVTQDRIIPYYAPNSSIKHNKSDSKDRSQEIL